MAVGCGFITCALKQRGIESCGHCADLANCGRWQKLRQEGRSHDSFVSYRALEDNTQFIARQGLAAFDQAQRQKEAVLKAMLRDFNEGRPRSYYCIAATVLDTDALAAALTKARRTALGLEIKAKAKALHAILDAAARAKGLALKLRH